MLSWKQTCVSVVDGVVSSMGHRDKKLRIEYCFVSFNDIFYIHRIHVMNINSVVNIVAFDTKITAIISSDYMTTYIAPFR